MLNVNLNIPLYRAEKIGSNEYVEGYYFRDENLIPKEEHRMQVTKLNPNIQIGLYGSHKHEYLAIDPTTLAIHFPDMIDSQGNKIFASLQENKKHGDIIHNIIAPNNFGKMIVYWNNVRNAVCYEEENYCTPLQYLLKDELKDYKIIGIQK